MRERWIGFPCSGHLRPVPKTSSKKLSLRTVVLFLSRPYDFCGPKRVRGPGLTYSLFSAAKSQNASLFFKRENAVTSVE
jgi:hypothetical protein